MEFMDEFESRVLEDLPDLPNYAGIKMEFDFQEYIANTNLPKPLVILDLNGTILFSTWRPVRVLPSSVEHNGTSQAIRVGKKCIYPRPHLKEFLEVLFRNFRVAVWSSHSDENVGRIVDAVFTDEQRARLHFVWGRSKCITSKGAKCGSESTSTSTSSDPKTFKKYLSIKSFANIVKYVSGECLERTIIIDDSSEKIRGFRHCYNIKTYGENDVKNGHRNSEDCELKKLGEWLIEWRDRVESLPLPPDETALF